VMRCDIPPSVQFGQVLETRRIPWVGSRQIQREAEAFEVFPQVLEVGVAVVEGTMGRELVLDEDLKRGAHPGDNDLGRFRVKVAAEPLEVGAEQDDLPAQILFAEARVGRSQRQRCSALGFDLVQWKHAIAQPMQQRGGRHRLLLGLRGQEGRLA
jgi:hypothetical protein